MNLVTGQSPMRKPVQAGRLGKLGVGADDGAQLAGGRAGIADAQQDDQAIRDPIARLLEDGRSPTTRVLETAGPLVEQLDLAGAELVPVVKLLGRYKRELVAQVANVAAATQAQVEQPDGVRRHYLRSLSPLHNEVPARAAPRPLSRGPPGSGGPRG